MKKTRLSLFLAAFVILLGGVVWFAWQRSHETHVAPLRVGWQTAWATQGQVVEALKHTDILQQNGLTAAFTGFAAGPPAIEAALAGSLDIVSGGSQPMLQLIAKSKDWVIVSRHANVHLGILVPRDAAVA